MSHTKEPWLIRTLENFGFNVVHYNGGDKFDIVRVAKCSDGANADRIVACVNGCAGINPDAIADVVEALRWFINDIDGTHTKMVEFDDNVELARSALAKLESGKP